MTKSELLRQIMVLALEASTVNEPWIETALLNVARLANYPANVQGLLTSMVLMAFMVADD